MPRTMTFRLECRWPEHHIPAKEIP